MVLKCNIEVKRVCAVIEADTNKMHVGLQANQHRVRQTSTSEHHFLHSKSNKWCGGNKPEIMTPNGIDDSLLIGKKKNLAVWTSSQL